MTIRRELAAPLFVLLSLLPLLLHYSTDGAVIKRAWTQQHWCRSVEAPHWPFAYQKFPGQTVEWKGRVNPNAQDMRHICAPLGVQSKCHRCSDISCGTDGGSQCAYQLQGIAWTSLPTNIPTVTDVPWAVGGAHRYDYRNGSRLCVFLSGGDCLSPLNSNYSGCTVRCWGVNSGPISSRPSPIHGDAATLPDGDAGASDLWSYPVNSSGDGRAQGRVGTLAGSGQRGFVDGSATAARFNNPQDVAVDSRGNVYVADTDNHCVRKIDGATKTVTTLAGNGVQGFADGGALTTARFSFPTGVAVYENATSGQVTVLVADTANHRIRKIVGGVVSCIGGLCGAGVESEILAASPAWPHPGLADGDPASSRFDSPMGVAVDPATGIVYVADTGNHLIRSIFPNGTTSTVAGNVAPAHEADIPGCVSPCLRGVPGFRDGNLTYARFNSPRDVTVGLQSTLVVADGHRVRRVTLGTATTIEGVTSRNRVVTLAGSNVPGGIDGPGDEATFLAPAGVTVTGDGRVYVVSPVACSVRQLSPATLVARDVTCSTTAAQVLLPSGCSSYEPPVDELFLFGSPARNNIYYNYAQRSGHDPVRGLTMPGRIVRDCTGSPPIDGLDTGNLSLARRNGTFGQVLVDLKEDTGDGTIVKLRCPAGCLSSSTGAVFGSTLYSDASAICLAAIHAGVITSAAGGLIQVMLQRGIGFANDSVRLGSSSNGVRSLDLPSVRAASRLFSATTYARAQIEVQTVAGAPAASLSRRAGCGFMDAAPATASRLDGATGIEVFYGVASLSRTQTLLIADARNHRVRLVTASCAKICENGGECTAPDVCTCASGWVGDDCSLPVCRTACGSNQVCIGPDTCACVPGYSGFPSCTTPQCVQSCRHGVCSYPDTCTCDSGWFDANCSTPVCEQTCGNGGNCTAPDTCTCSAQWTGSDCRVPICSQHCANGGSCVAPDSCLCATGWSGHDCTKPVCGQGEFVPDPSGLTGATARPRHSDMFVPCDWAGWCAATGEFDCLARLEPSHFAKFDAPAASVGGRQCLLLELGATALSSFPYLDEHNASHGFFRFSPTTTFGWNASPADPWRAIATANQDGGVFLPPFDLKPDRQAALVERRRMVQGVYGCANGGSCIAPDVCQCASGWVGFDCRTPVCSQGYFSPAQSVFLAAEPPEAAHSRQPISNPTYNATVETIAYDTVTIATETRGGIRYEPLQGGYACSIRSVTQWEKPATFGPNASAAATFAHPNYFSRYMDTTVSADGVRHTQWVGMYWPPLYELSSPLLDNTREGWRRAGTWSVVAGAVWQKGTCLLEFQRVCEASGGAFMDVITGVSSTVAPVVDPDAAFRPRVVLSSARADRRNFWNATLFGSCVDRVLRGCFNNGTCVAPDTCVCAAGWSGSDCSVPVCSQQCLHGGNCTLPDTCTCERGWAGADCSVPLCAQECRNGGTCVAPDECECRQWSSTWRDGRGEPVFRLPDGRARFTGYTGFDCGTPICVQAPDFILNVERTSNQLVALRGHGKTATLECSGYRCPQFDAEVVANDGQSFQAGCSVGNPVAHVASTLSRAEQLANLAEFRDDRNVNRTSDSHLCGILAWEQGDYLVGRTTRVNYVNVTRSSEDDSSSWQYGVMAAGEGVFACYNRGSCVAPDTCSCGDGWSGVDCNLALCRFLQPNGSVSGCLHGGVCVDRDVCACLQVNSTLHDQYPSAPTGVTGYFGSDCGMPVCVQGVFDPACSLSGDGCYRCKNGGTCIAPDECQCAEGWSGFDCSTPVCRLDAAVAANASVREQLFTVDEKKVTAFLADPCGSNGGRWGKELINGALLGQGNCTLPGKCTCLCRQRYDATTCDESGERCEQPWHDPFGRNIPDGYVYGTRDCVDGFQGLEDADGDLISCHLQVYVPSTFRRYTASLVAVLSIAALLASLAWYYIRKRVRRALLLAKAERRRSRKNSERDVLMAKPNAFMHPKLE